MVNKSPDGQMSFTIVNPQMVVDSMRNSGYKSTTHALAELIDNSIEAGATQIEVFGVSRPDRSLKRGIMKLHEIAVLDNGDGMDSDTLRGSLRYGHGTRIKRRGIGRFGMGLPNSSMSQARRVDIWSWQSGVTNAIHTCLSIEAVLGGMKEIPKPRLKQIPEIYRTHGNEYLDDKGTLVVWSQLERIEWTRASTLFLHMENLVGRIYRRFLANPSVRLHPSDSRNDEIGPLRTITCIPIEIDAEIVVKNKAQVRPVDPLYLMSGTSCPEDFGDGPMFEEFVEPIIIPILYKGKTNEVRIRASHARPHVRDSNHDDANWPIEWRGKDSGRTPWGKHANTNTGISIMRAHREIDIDRAWKSGDDPRERWWTVEIDFPTDLDEIFGVTINKQGAPTFQNFAHFDWQREALGEETYGDVRRRMEEEGDLRVHLLKISDQIERLISPMRKRVRQSVQRRGKRNSEGDNADAKATTAVKRRIGEGHKGESDRAAEVGTPEEHTEIQVKSLRDKHHLDEETARERVLETVISKYKVRWLESSQNSPAFFDVESLPAVIQVAFNNNHPVYKYLYELMLVDDIVDLGENELRLRLDKAVAAFRILIYSWARFEDEQRDGHRKKIRNARYDWGKYADEFFDEDH